MDGSSKQKQVTICENFECCIDGNCVDPICDNCHNFSPDAFYECGHLKNDTECRNDWCIENYINTATCDYKGPDWPCKKSQCDTYPDGDQKATIQFKREIANCPTGGQPVEYRVIHTTYIGCEDCQEYSARAACLIEECGGELLDLGAVGQKYKCGCP